MGLESTFYRYIHSNLPKSIYYEKTSNRFRRGIPDFYYESDKGRILWVEYKIIRYLWPKARTSTELISSPQWQQQRQWLVRAHQHGIPALLIVGLASEAAMQGLIIPPPFNYDPEMDSVLTVSQIADSIKKILLEPPQI